MRPYRTRKQVKSDVFKVFFCKKNQEINKKIKSINVFVGNALSTFDKNER